MALVRGAKRPQQTSRLVGQLLLLALSFVRHVHAASNASPTRHLNFLPISPTPSGTPPALGNSAQLIQLNVAAQALADLEWTALHLAAWEADEDLAQQAVSLGAQVDAKNGDGTTPLHFAALVGSLPVAKILIHAGANVDAQNTIGLSPLAFASFHNHLAVAKLLLKEGADPNSAAESKETPLMFTPNTDAVEIARELIDAGALVDLKDRNGETALHEAATYGAQNVVKLLLEEGADPNATDTKGRTPATVVCLCITFTEFDGFQPCGLRQCSPYDTLRTKAVFDEFEEKEKGANEDAPQVAASPKERLQQRLEEERMKKTQKKKGKGGKG